VAVYLLHSSVPLVRADGREVRHYLGWTGEGCFPRRLEAHHANHKSARIVQAFLLAGGKLCLGNYWPDLTRADERRMKQNGHLEAKCLLCQIHRLQRELTALRGTALASKPTPTEPS
jgi:hypothetical protein